MPIKKHSFAIFLLLIVSLFLFQPASSLAIFEVVERPSGQPGIAGLLGNLSETGRTAFGRVVTSGIDASSSFFESTVGRLLAYGLSMIGVVLIGMLTYGGIIWVNARGRDEEVDKAKDIIRESIIGIGLVLAAFALVYAASFVFYQATNPPNPAFETNPFE